MDDLFPKIQKSIETLIEDEEGNIPGNKLLMLGTMVMILGTLFPWQAFAGHRSHSSHDSHDSHSSHSSGSGGHGSHVSHESHQSHQSASDHSNHSNHASHNDHISHISHSSHSNTGAHSNSRFSVEGDVSYAPDASSIQGITVAPVKTTEHLFQLPSVNQNIESPNGTPGSGILPNLAVPASTAGAKIDAGELHTPSSTEVAE